MMREWSWPGRGSDTRTHRIKESSISGSSRSVRRTAKIIPLSPPRRQRRRGARVGTVIVALGVIGSIVARIDGLHSARIQTISLQSPLAAQEFRLLKIVNDKRVQAGLAPLQFSRYLMIAARNHSSDMAARGYLGHDSPAGDTPADRARTAGINYDELGENIYRGNAADADSLPERVVDTWMQSPAHRANLLSPGFRLSAVGVARADNGLYYVTQDFVR
jgi:uncharacterized protein YkwD